MGDDADDDDDDDNDDDSDDADDDDDDANNENGVADDDDDKDDDDHSDDEDDNDNVAENDDDDDVDILQKNCSLIKKLRRSVIGRGDVKIGEYQNSNLCSPSMPDFFPVVSLLLLKAHGTSLPCML